MAGGPVRFPITEGLGIFIGIVAWDVLTAGETALLKASLIAVAASLVWYGARYWRATTRRRRGLPE